MDERFERTALLFGEENINKLSSKRVAVFGVGGVGGYVVEALVRSGIVKIDIIDKDVVSISNINRQIIATTDSIGKAKVDDLKERIISINPNADVKTYKTFFMPENSADFNFNEYDYVIDCVDTVTAKIEIIKCAKEKDVPVISSMGAGNKLDPTGFLVSDIYNTSVCPLARVMRKELKARNIDCLKVVYSKEKAIKPIGGKKDLETGKQIPGSFACIPSVVGLIIASEVIKDLIK